MKCGPKQDTLLHTPCPLGKAQTWRDGCCSRLRRPSDNAAMPKVEGHRAIRRNCLWFDLRFPWFTIQQRKYLLNIPLGFAFCWEFVLTHFALWCQHVLIRFGLLPSGSLEIIEFGGLVGSPGRGAPKGGSKPLKSCWDAHRAILWQGGQLRAWDPLQNQCSPLPPPSCPDLHGQPGKCSLSTVSQEGIRHQI